jgi:predicted enzyme related to lactoylglutathione lyase
MPERTKYEHGTFCWVDLSAHDMDAAVAWYGGLFGWTLEIQPSHGGPPYGMFFQDGKPVAGIGQLSDEMKQRGVPPTWNNYVSVDDAAAIEKRVVELGGSVVFPTMKANEAGWLAFFTDPSGAMFAVWQAGEHCGANLVNEPGTFCWNELASKDVAASREFYGDLFGWTFKSDGGSPDYTEFCVGEQVGGGMLPMQPEWGEMPPYWMVYFCVDDIESSTNKVAETGGKVLMPPKTIDHVGTFSVVQDPQGAVFSLIKLEIPTS